MGWFMARPTETLSGGSLMKCLNTLSFELMNSAETQGISLPLSEREDMLRSVTTGQGREFEGLPSDSKTGSSAMGKSSRIGLINNGSLMTPPPRFLVPHSH